MSFLDQTDQEFIKHQLGPMLVSKIRRNKLKKEFRKLGLYSSKNGYRHYRNFFQIQIPRKRRMQSMPAVQQSQNTQRHREQTPRRTFKFSSPPRRTQKFVSKDSRSPILKIGVGNTPFFKRNKIAVSAAILYTLVSPINVLDSPMLKHKQNRKLIVIFKQYPRALLIKLNNGNVNYDMVSSHINAFLHIASHIQAVLPQGPMTIPADLKKLISSTYNEMSENFPKSMVGKIKDYRISNFLSKKKFSSVLSESISKFFARRYPYLSDQYFMEFAMNFIFTHNLKSQMRLCFDMYDKDSLNAISTSNIYQYFQSQLFPLIKQDLYVMTQQKLAFVQDISQDINQSQLLNKRQVILPKIQTKNTQKQPNLQGKITFRQFLKLPFTQKFPDMLLAIIYSLFGAQACDFMCEYHLIPLYKVFNSPKLSLLRCKNDFSAIYQAIDYKWNQLKPEIPSMQSNLDPEVLQGAVMSYLLLCDMETITAYRQYNLFENSLVTASLVLFGDPQPVLAKRFFFHMRKGNRSSQIDLEQFLQNIYAFFDVKFKQSKTMHEKCYELLDEDGDGQISVSQILGILSEESRVISNEFQEEIKKWNLDRITKIMHQSRNFLNQSGNFLRYINYKQMIEVPAYSKFLRKQLLFNLENKTKQIDRLIQEKQKEFSNLLSK